MNIGLGQVMAWLGYVRLGKVSETGQRCQETRGELVTKLQSRRKLPNFLLVDPTAPCELLTSFMSILCFNVTVFDLNDPILYFTSSLTKEMGKLH
jgi:hypothetical protein